MVVDAITPAALDVPLTTFVYRHAPFETPVVPELPSDPVAHIPTPSEQASRIAAV